MALALPALHPLTAVTPQSVAGWAFEILILLALAGVVIALTNARTRIWIQSPYFVPDEPLITAMCAAAQAGVDVRFMMTSVPDKKIPLYAAHAYYPQLLRAGVRVYLYTTGFLHAKTVTLDDQFSLIGTCNWVIRSFILHDEVVAVFYDESTARLYAEQYARDIEKCREVTPEWMQSLSGPAKFRNSVYRLFSRLLGGPFDRFPAPDSA